MTASDNLKAPVVHKSSDYRVIFTHVPKVAGTAIMRQLVRANYQKDEIKEFRGVKNLVRTRSDSYRALVGHSVYGMHTFMKGDCRYFTMLRDPMSRAVSHITL